MLQNINHYYSIAPMMGKTDSYFCFLMSLINNNITIYTEMMHSEAVIRTNILNNIMINFDILPTFLDDIILYNVNSDKIRDKVNIGNLHFFNIS